MGKITITKYSPGQAAEWDAFVDASKNGTFLFHRAYMDYHSDRFCDFSLMTYRRGKLYGLLPANVQGDTLYSHGGLTYGGLVMDDHATAADVIETFTSMNDYLFLVGVKRVVYKAVPVIYHRRPAEEDLYAIFNACGARLARRSVSTVVCCESPVKWRRVRVCGAAKAASAGVTIKQENDPRIFWEILSSNLRNKYNVSPVHNVGEITLLMNRFPDNIKLFTAGRDGLTLGGVLLYITDTVAHAQYISASEVGKEAHALDLLFRELMQTYLSNHRYFDFGTSTEDNGRVLNEQLIYQKEGFGGRAICYDTYEWTV